jgi:hypothetical protein
MASEDELKRRRQTLVDISKKKILQVNLRVSKTYLKCISAHPSNTFEQNYVELRRI